MPHRILITGCSTGIGRALAAELAARGLYVIATARHIASLNALPVAAKLELDVTDPASVERAVAVAGQIDVLVNNAGVGAWGPVEAADDAEIDALFDTNVFGPLRMIRAVAPQMRARRAGAIYQISSAAAQRSNALLGHYSATKAALEAYSAALRIELARFGVSVSIVVLGSVTSGFAENRRTFDMDAHREVIDAMTSRIQANRAAPATSEAVARRIADVVERGRPPLRLNATEDAEVLVAQRRGQSDEEWERATLASLFPKV